MKKKSDERGAIMLEAMIVVIFTMIILIWLLALGFVYYQRYLVTATANDVVVKVADTFYRPDSDLVMGYSDSRTAANRSLYRGGSYSASMEDASQQRAQKYADVALKRVNFVGTVKDVKVDLKLVRDSVMRKHIEIKLTATFNTPFGYALDFFGMDGIMTYSASARADCTDPIDYISTVDFANYQLGKVEGKGKFISMVNKFMKLYSHKYQKK